MYAATIGAWSEYLVAGIAFMCMFGTTLAVMDGYARTLNESVHMLVSTEEEPPRWSLNVWIVAQAFAGMAIILFFQSALAPMLSFAMTLAFITTPFFAWLNFDLVRKRHISKGMNALAWIGLVYLTAFAVAFIFWWLFAS